jgi:hypothetical protein
VCSDTDAQSSLAPDISLLTLLGLARSQYSSLKLWGVLIKVLGLLRIVHTGGFMDLHAFMELSHSAAHHPPTWSVCGPSSVRKSMNEIQMMLHLQITAVRHCGGFLEVAVD